MPTVSLGRLLDERMYRQVEDGQTDQQVPQTQRSCSLLTARQHLRTEASVASELTCIQVMFPTTLTASPGPQAFLVLRTPDGISTVNCRALAQRSRCHLLGRRCGQRGGQACAGSPWYLVRLFSTVDGYITVHGLRQLCVAFKGWDVTS